MTGRMQLPLTQRRHTNVAVVRYHRNGVKLEVACYKNKVISYRSGAESNLDEVLQVDRVFSNVSKGSFASMKEIERVFGKGCSETDAIKEIVSNGELQVSQNERTAEVDKLFKSITFTISQKCVHSVTQRPFSTHVIEQALRSIGAAVQLDQSEKKQSLALMHQLIESEVIPITRAKMKLRCTVVSQEGLTKLRAWCQEHDAVIQDAIPPQGGGATPESTLSLLIIVPPNLFRELELYTKAHLPECTVNMIESAVILYEGHETPSEGVSSPVHVAPAVSDHVTKGDTTGPVVGERDDEHAKADGYAAPPTTRVAKKKKKSKGKMADTDSDSSGDDEAPRRGRRKGGGMGDLSKELNSLAVGHLHPDESSEESDDSDGGAVARRRKNKRANKKR